MLLRASKLFLYAALLCVVFVLSRNFFPFIGGKYYFFRIMVEASLAFFLLHWAFAAAVGTVEKHFKEIIARPLVIAVSAFVLMYLLASVFAYDASGSFWSNYERGEGGFQMLHYYIFFLLLLALFRSERDWRIAFGVFIAAATVMMAYGFLAQGALPWKIPGLMLVGPYMNNLPDTLWGRITGTRFQGSLGNPAYVAPYLMFAMAFAAYLWMTYRGARKAIWGVLYGAFFVLSLFVFMLSQTRGAFLGLAAAMIVFLLYLGVFRTAYRTWALSALGACLFAGATLVHFRSSAFVQMLPGARLFDFTVSDTALVFLALGGFLLSACIMFLADRRYRKWALIALGILVALGIVLLAVGKVSVNIGDQTAKTRFWTWNSAWQGFKERPLLGWGPENFSAVFDKYFDPRHFKVGEGSETWFDRAHSIVFDYLAETGILGFLAYIGIFAAYFFGLFRMYRKKYAVHQSLRSICVLGILLALPVGYLVQGFVLFDVLPIYLGLFLFLAFAEHQFKTADLQHIAP